MKKKKQVYFVWNYLSWGGAQIYLLSIAKQADKSEWDFKVILPRKSNPEILKYFEQNEISYEFLDVFLDISDAKGIFEKLKRQWHRLHAEITTYFYLSKFDLKNSIVHIEVAPWQSWILLYLLSIKGNVVVTMHNALPLVISKWRKMLWKSRLDFLLNKEKFHLFAANQNSIDSLKNITSPKYWNRFLLTRATINPVEINEIYTENFDKISLLKKHNLPADKFVILCVGQFIDRKGRWIFLESAQKISELNPQIHFVWVAPSFPNEEDQQKIDALKLKNFNFLLSENVGRDREEVLTFFRVADIFTLPSLWEGLPIAILEAMSLGIPTISTELNAIPEAIKHNETGILVKVGDSENLTNEILRLFENSKLREQLSENGRKFIIENFDERIVGQIVLEYYEKCLAN